MAERKVDANSRPHDKKRPPAPDNRGKAGKSELSDDELNNVSAGVGLGDGSVRG